MQKSEYSEDKQDIWVPLRQNLHPIGKQASDKLLQYQQLMINGCQPNIDESAFIKNGIFYDPTNFIQKMSFEVIAQTINSEATALRVGWGYFTLVIILIKVERESLMHFNEKMCGGFAEVFFERGESQQAIKCIKYSKFKSKKKAEISAIRQYFLAKLASALQAGPCLTNYLGFDLVIYKDCIQFSMEKCHNRYKNYENLVQITKQNLLNLHQYHIIHFDIKPSNILYSQAFQRYVVIDYGLSSIVRERLGEKSSVGFKGSIPFVSDQMMLALHSEQKQWVDVYYNDCYSMMKTLHQMKDMISLITAQAQRDQGLIEDYSIQLQKRKLFLLARMKYHLLRQDIIKTQEIYQRNLKFINKQLMIDFLNFFKVLEPTQNIIGFYKKIESEQKYRFELRQTNEIMNVGLYRSDYNYLKRYLLNLERNVLFGQTLQIQNLDLSYQIDQNSKNSTQNAIFLLLTSENSQSISAQRYFQLFIRFISLTNNIFDSQLKERVYVANYCIQNILKIQLDNSEAPLELINTCIMHILLYYANYQGIVSLDTKNVKIRKNTFFNLLEHAFILGKTATQRMLKIIQQIFYKYFRSFEQKLEFVFKIRTLMQWTVQKYESLCKFDQMKFVDRLSLWLFEVFDELVKDRGDKCKDVLSLLSLYLHMTPNKDYIGTFDNINILKIFMFSDQFNQQLALYYEFLMMQISCEFVIMHAQILFRMTRFEDKFKLFPWTLKIYQYYCISCNFQMAFRTYKLIQSNLKFGQLLSEFYIFDGNKLIYVKGEQHQLILFEQIMRKVTVNLVLNQYRYTQFLLYTYLRLFDMTAQHKQYKLSNQRIQALLDRLNDRWPLSGRQFCLDQSSHHICMHHSYLNTISNLKEAYYYLKGPSHQQNVQDRLFIRMISIPATCQQCRWIIQLSNLLAQNQHTIKIFEKDTMLIKQEFFKRYDKINALIEQGFYQTLKRDFELNNIYGLALFCITNRDFQAKFGGVKKLYYYLKKNDLLKKYVLQKPLSQTLFVTMEVLLSISFEELVYFINSISTHLTKNYSRHSFQLVVIAVSTVIIPAQQFDYQIFMRLIKLNQTQQNSYLVPFYFLTIEYQIKIRHKLNQAYKQILKLAKFLDKCMRQITRQFSFYRIFLSLYSVFEKNINPRRLKHLFRRTLRDMTLYQAAQNLITIKKSLSKKRVSNLHDKRLKEKMETVGNVFPYNLRQIMKVFA